MKTADAKFLLRACRPDGRDAADPLFAEALAQARQDPVLHDWVMREQAVDAVVAAKLAAVMPPAGLRDAILVGARASRQPQRAWWQNPLWLAAACVAVAFTLANFFRRPVAPPTNEFAALALHDLATAETEHRGHNAGLAALDAKISDPAATVPTELTGLDLAVLRSGGCRSFTAGGHEVFEICFNRDGRWFHLYIANPGDFPTAASNAPVVATSAAHAAVTWSEGGNLYALVTDAGPAALRRVLGG
jgi:hypothetical protein